MLESLSQSGFMCYAALLTILCTDLNIKLKWGRCHLELFITLTYQKFSVASYLRLKSELISLTLSSLSSQISHYYLTK